eukprot:TRINITY_DN5749_c0_g1_i1.p2 TRINITY_DN5749_c0_g1~~TRINITY_DN5749_c0_g1_i1.p2  ORF type:complete len:131 (-),score=10.56 TRINITY_DN5749_c0_g1_i1:42-434(-)
MTYDNIIHSEQLNIECPAVVQKKIGSPGVEQNDPGIRLYHNRESMLSPERLLAYQIFTQYGKPEILHNNFSVSVLFLSEYDPTFGPMSVSYTHLTLPTKRIVQISVGAVSFKKKIIQLYASEGLKTRKIL